MRLALIVLLACSWPAASALAAGPSDDLLLGDCGDPFQNAYGPFDYRTATAAQKKIVESYHFTPSVETLQAGNTSAIGSDIDYTLRAFPNHPRALMAMIRLGQRAKTEKPRGAHYSVACYLERALQFRPDDMNARQLRGIFYSLHGHYREAIDDFNTVLEKEPDNANAHYNLGLAYLELKQYPKAVQEAKRAKSLGFSLPGLEHMLKSAGKWTE